MKKLILAVLIGLAALTGTAEAGSKKVRFFVKTESMVRGFVGPLQTARMTPIKLIVRLKRMGYRKVATEFGHVILKKRTRMGRGVLTSTYMVSLQDNAKHSKAFHAAVKKVQKAWNKIMKKKYGRK